MSNKRVHHIESSRRIKDYKLLEHELKLLAENMYLLSEQLDDTKTKFESNLKLGTVSTALFMACQKTLPNPEIAEPEGEEVKNKKMDLGLEEIKKEKDNQLWL